MTLPNRVVNKIMEAVQEAISCGVDPRAFVIEVKACWDDELKDKARSDGKTFEELLSRRP